MAEEELDEAALELLYAPEGLGIEEDPGVDEFELVDHASGLEADRQQSESLEAYHRAHPQPDPMDIGLPPPTLAATPPGPDLPPHASPAGSPAPEAPQAASAVGTRTIHVSGTTNDGDIDAYLDADAPAAHVPQDLLIGSDLLVRSYQFRPGRDGWRIEIQNRAIYNSRDIIVENLTVTLPDRRWRVRWPTQTGWEQTSASPNVWALKNTNEHPNKRLPEGQQLLTGGLSMFVEVLGPSESELDDTPNPDQERKARWLLRVATGRDDHWPGLKAARMLGTCELYYPDPQLPPANAGRTAGEFLLGGWPNAYPSSSVDAEPYGPIFFLLPRWGNHDLNMLHYNWIEPLIAEWIRRGDRGALQCALDMGRRLATVLLARSHGGATNNGWPYEKGQWPHAYMSPAVEKAWDRQLLLCYMLSPDDPIWVDAIQRRITNLLWRAQNPFGVWPERYGMRRPSRILENLADVWEVAYLIDMDQSLLDQLRDAAFGVADYTWGAIPVGQHYGQNTEPNWRFSDGSRGTGAKTFMQSQWAPACARWHSFDVYMQARGVDDYTGFSKFAQRTKDWVKWQVETLVIEQDLRVPYVFSEDADAGGKPTKLSYLYTQTARVWMLRESWLYSHWFEDETDPACVWRRLWAKLHSSGIFPGNVADGFDDRSGGTGRPKTWASRLWVIDDTYVPDPVT